jgi:hypothetical protein
MDMFHPFIRVIYSCLTMLHQTIGRLVHNKLRDPCGEMTVLYFEVLKSKTESKAVPISTIGYLYGCEMLMIPHCIDNRLTVNCEILATCSSTYRPVRTSQEAHSVSIN